MVDKVTTFSLVKDSFFLIGSLAGLFAFIRPISESKHQKDCSKLMVLLKELEDVEITNLEFETYQARRVPDSVFGAIHGIGYRLKANDLDVNMNGPLAKLIADELTRFDQLVNDYRSFVQVPFWEPISLDDSNELFRQFNRKYFDDRDLDYPKALEQAAMAADRIILSYKRLKILSEVHFLEAFFMRSLGIKRKLDKNLLIGIKE
jgi:hypothetical protein